jgi:hypothetical protein
MSENSNESRLPPPAFPPGSRRHVQSPDVDAPEPSADDAYISPDDPMPERVDSMGGAFISPDEPIPERVIELVEEFQPEGVIEEDEGDGVVVGMDLNPHLDPSEVVSGGDPHVMEVMEAVEKLAAALHHRGEAGLRSTPEMTQFEATLRSYCVGYLAGRRAEDPPTPIVEEPLSTDG